MSYGKLELASFDPERFKRKAKQHSKARGIPHVRALNELARPYGFETYESLHRHWLASPKPEIEVQTSAKSDVELDAILTWFRSRYTRHNAYESRVSPRIARSLRHFERSGGGHQVPVVDIDDEIDFGYQPRAFQLDRHPKALAAEQILEAEGPWVANSFLDGLRVRRGGLFEDRGEYVVGDRFTIIAIDEEQTEGSI